MILTRFASAAWPLLLVLMLGGCSDQRVSFEIDSPTHTLSLIRVTSFPWDKSADYAIVAARMPDCQRRHTMPEAALDVTTEVYSPGNDAWILKQGDRLFVVETRSCEGFATLDKAPDTGLGTLLGRFEMRGDTLVFTPAPRVASPAVVEPAAPPPANPAT